MNFHQHGKGKGHTDHGNGKGKGHDKHHVDNDFIFDQPLPESDRNANGNIPYGDGTTPPNGFFGVENENFDFHIYTTQRYRTVAEPINPTSATVVGNSLELDYQIAAGTQSIANGSNANRTDRAASNDDIVVGTDDGKTLAQLMGEGVEILRFYDTDPTAAEDFIVFEARLDPVNGNLDWYVQNTNTPGPTDDGGDANTSANSFNRLFLPGVTTADLVAGAEFDDYVRAYSPDGTLLFQIHNDILLV
jgi:hypothetical protein